MSVYQFTAETIKGSEKSLSDYKGKVLLIVNTASKCGLTPQFEGLQRLYDQYKDAGLEILGFPSNQFREQDPGSNEEIQQFCQINYGVSFPMFSKIDVNGEHAHPLYGYLKQQTPGSNGEDIEWNFGKFLIGRDGEPVKRFSPRTEPQELEQDIQQLIGKQ